MPLPPPAVLEAIAEADQIVLGPGRCSRACSPPASCPASARRFARRTGARVYVANLREQVPETAGFDVARLLASLRDHEVPVDVVLADRTALPIGELPDDVRLVVAELAK